MKAVEASLWKRVLKAICHVKWCHHCFTVRDTQTYSSTPFGLFELFVASVSQFISTMWHVAQGVGKGKCLCWWSLTFSLLVVTNDSDDSKWPTVPLLIHFQHGSDRELCQRKQIMSVVQLFSSAVSWPIPTPPMQIWVGGVLRFA